MRAAKTKYVYIGQFNSFWRLTTDEWADVCRSGVMGLSYDLSKYRELQGKPIWLEKYPNQSSYRRLRTDVLYFEPLDWSLQDWQEALDELSEGGR